MEGLDADMDIEQIEMKIARMKRAIARKQQTLRKWEKAAKIMKNTSRSEVQEREPDAASCHEDPASPGVPVGDPVACCGLDDPPARVENPPCITATDVLANSGNDLSDGKTSVDTLPQLVAQDPVQKEEPSSTESAAILALRRSSRRSRSSYILNSDEFITLDFRHTKSKKKPGGQVSPESKSSPAASVGDSAALWRVFPEPPPIVAEQPIVDFFLPEDEFAAWKIRFRRKTSLRSSTSQARATGEIPRNVQSVVQGEGVAMEKSVEGLEVPLLSRFESLLTLDTLSRETVELVHCGTVVLGTATVRAIAAVQNSRISVWAEEDDEWTLQPKVPLGLQLNGLYKFSGFNSPSSMGLALVAETGGEKAVWCYDLSPPGRKCCLETLQGRSSCAILCCVVGETLVYAQVGSRYTRLKTYHLDVLGAKQPRHLNNIKDELNSLQPIAELKDAVVGCSATSLYVWNHVMGQLYNKMQAPGNSPFQKCTFAQEESGLLVLGVVTGDSNPRHYLMVVNPARHKWRVLREYQDVVELPNQCLQGTTRVGQHLVAGGGTEIGRVAIWNVFSGNLAAFLNDDTVTAVCSFPPAFSRDFLIVTGTRQGDVILYKLPFPQL